MVQWLRLCLAVQRCQFDPWSRKILGFPCDSAGKESASNAGGLGLIPGLGRSPGEGIRQYSRLENSMDYIVHGVTKSWTRLSNFHFHWEDSTCFGVSKSWVTTTEALLPRAWAPQEKPPQWEACALQLESSSCSLLLEKAHMQQWRPSTAKHKNKWKNNNPEFQNMQIAVSPNATKESKHWLVHLFT